MKRHILTYFLVIFTSLHSFASHVAGGNITWTCTGTNTYLITLTLYRDCGGIPLNNTILTNTGSFPSFTNNQFSISNSCGVSPSFIGSANLTLISTTEVSQLCPAQLPQSQCNGGSYPGMEEYVYQTQVTLPPCDFWTFSYTLCCRNSAITNLASPANDWSTIQSTLCNATGPSCNNSPIFTAQPIPYICNNAPFCYDYGVIEPDGHSLSYSFTSALNNGNPSPYSGGYSSSSPIPGITIDQNTGQICFTPTINGNFVVTIVVNETDASGNTIGTYMQDIQFVVQNCSNSPPNPNPTISNTTGTGTVTGNSSIELCKDGNFCTDITFTDTDAINIISLTSNVSSVLPGATLNVSNGNPATATVCWTENQGIPGFYSFTIDAIDDACPIPGINSFTVEITVLDSLHPNCFVCSLDGNIIAQTNVSCNGASDGSVTIEGDLGVPSYQYSINGGTTWQNNGSFNSLQVGTYVILIEDSDTCQTAVNVDIIEPGILTSNATTLNDASGFGICDASTLAQVSGGTPPLNYLWDDPLAQTDSTASSLCAGTFCVIVTDSNGCIDSSCTTVIEPAPIVISSSTINVDCNGNCNGSVDVNVSGGIGPYTFSWSGPNAFSSNLEDLSGLCPGQYSLALTDFNGISSFHNVSISEPSLLSATIQSFTDAICYDSCNGTATIAVMGGTNPYTYAWSGTNNYTSSDQNVTNLCIGNYSLTITDFNLCSTSLTVAIDEPTQINLNTNFTSSNCGQADGLVGVTATGGTVANDYSYLWTLNGNFVDTNALVAGLLAGTYGVTVTDDYGCIGNTIETITDIPGGTASATQDISASCYGFCDGQATGTISGGTPPFSYSWSSGSTPNLPTTNNLCAGLHTVSITDNVGCISQVNVLINQPDSVFSNTTITHETCIGDCLGEINVSGQGGFPPYQYSFDGGNSFSYNTISSNLCASNYPIVVLDANGCYNNFVVEILSGNQYSNATIDSFGPMCENDSPVALTAVDPGGDWIGFGINGNEFDPQLVFPGTYTISYQISSDCGDTGFFDVTVHPLPNVSFSADIFEGCVPLQVNFTNTGDPGIACNWDFGDGNNSNSCSNASNTFSTAGSYDVTFTLTDLNNCANSATQVDLIDVFPLPSANFSYTPTQSTIVDPVVYFTDLSNDAISWNWDFQIGSSTVQNPIFNFENQGIYSVELTINSANGCEDVIIKVIEIKDEFLIYIPNAFSANDNGINDVFLPVSNGLDPINYDFYIFNRWGELIFESHNIDVGWDGTQNGEKCKQDTYVYKIFARDVIYGKNREFVGHVNLIR